MHQDHCANLNIGTKINLLINQRFGLNSELIIQLWSDVKPQ